MFNQNPYQQSSEANKDIKVAGVQYERNPDAAYGEHIKNTTALCNTSASHTYGNVLSVIEKFLIDTFPANLFKTVTASTTLASRQLNHLPVQLSKKEAPIMVLVPRIVFGQDDNRFLGNTLINSRITNTAAQWGEGSLLQLAHDRKRNMYIHGHYNRAVMYVDVVMSFNTYSEQVNYMSYMHNMLPIGHNQMIKAPLELYIPEDFCELIANVGKVPTHDEDGSVHDFLTMMNGMFDYPITYKLKGGNNNDEFFMYYIADIDTVIQAPEAGPGIKDGQIRRNFDISFTVRCEFNTIGYFTLMSPDIKKPIRLNPNHSSDIVPIFSDYIDLNNFDIPIGWSILGWPIFKLNVGENRISISNILNSSLNAVIQHHLKFGIPMDKFIQIQFRENGYVVDDELFYIDWKKQELVLLNPNVHKTYRLIITVSQDYVNDLIKQLYNLE